MRLLPTCSARVSGKRYCALQASSRICSRNPLQKIVPVQLKRCANIEPRLLQRHRRFVAHAALGGSRVFIFGLGYVGVALAVTLHSRGWHVSGTCRDEDACENFRSEGVNAHTLDVDNEVHLSSEGQRAVAAASHIVSTVPPVGDFDQDPVLMTCQKGLIRMAPSLTWVGYISSTGVYGNHQGDWVGESSTLLADSGKNLARLKAEQAWQALHQQHDLPLQIFRLGGIYGPGRSALEAAAQQGASASQERRSLQKYTARCHVHDIVAVVLASMRRPHPGAIYNVVDDDPAPRSEVMAYARQLLGIDSGASGSDSTLAEHVSVGATGLAEKRVRNLKVKEELGVVLMAPTYREGLTALHRRDMTPFM